MKGSFLIDTVYLTLLAGDREMMKGKTEIKTHGDTSPDKVQRIFTYLLLNFFWKALLFLGSFWKKKRWDLHLQSLEPNFGMKESEIFSKNLANLHSQGLGFSRVLASRSLVWRRK